MPRGELPSRSILLVATTPSARVSSTKSLFSFSLKMHVLAGVLLVSGLQLARAHGGHSEGDRVAGETIQQYAQRHVSVVGLFDSLSGVDAVFTDVHGASHVRYRIWNAAYG